MSIDAVLETTRRGPTASSSDRTHALFFVAIGACTVAVVTIVLMRGPLAAIGGIDHDPGLLGDFGIYLDQARRLLAPHPSLAPHWLYPPLSAALFLGFASYSTSHARAIWGLIEVLLGGWLLLQCERQLHALPKLERWLGAIGLTLCSLPIAHCLKWGQISMLVLMLSLLAFERRGWSAAWLLGCAAGLKGYPLAYAWIYVLDRDWRALLRLAVATLALGVVLPTLLLGPITTAIMLRNTYDAALSLSTLTVWNETLSATIAKYFAPAIELPGAHGEPLVTLTASARLLLSWLGVGALLCVTGYRVHKASADRALTSFATVLAFSLVLGPAWVHYFVILPVAQAVLLARARDQRAAAAWFAASFAIDSLALVACLASAGSFPIVERSGAVSLAALAALFGLWSCMREKTAKPASGSDAACSGGADAPLAPAC